MPSFTSLTLLTGSCLIDIFLGFLFNVKRSWKKMEWLAVCCNLIRLHWVLANAKSNKWAFFLISPRDYKLFSAGHASALHTVYLKNATMRRYSQPKPDKNVCVSNKNSGERQRKLCAPAIFYCWLDSFFLRLPYYYICLIHFCLFYFCSVYLQHRKTWQFPRFYFKHRRSLFSGFIKCLYHHFLSQVQCRYKFMHEHKEMMRFVNGPFNQNLHLYFSWCLALPWRRARHPLKFA